MDLGTPTWYITYFYVIGVFSFALNLAVILLVIYKSESIDNFKYYILAFQVFCMLADFHISLLVQPMYLFQFMTYSCVGPAATYMWANYLLITTHLLLGIQYVLLFLCFARRHQAIAKIKQHHVIPEILFNSFIAFELACPVAACICYFYTGVEQEKVEGFIDQMYPDHKTELLSLQNYVIYRENTVYMIFFVIFKMLAGSLVFLLIALATLDMQKMLSPVRRKLSIQNYNHHKKVINSLLAQFAAVLVLLLPGLAFYTTRLYPYETGKWIVNITWCIFQSRSSINSLVLLASTPPYRNFLMRRLAGKREKVSTVVVSVHTRTGMN
ncbi:G protein-coupled receptor [Caenorhabditis elegans]|uniref:G protein-coupled receptor n=1 Tax=Caenorhabditis elegans TaxID=6239 RepID=Q9TZE8_CAEEL|nr:G protein-coupled receptor [Caenorhabditis elegans]CCD73601.1 G protein-coupled receptor [Caenorhabditis elegans]|eukprot:NP_494458.1 Serpentine Receptor, class I [Caenorhabditis elegans]